MAPAQLVGSACLLESLPGVVADRLQQPEPRLMATFGDHQAPVGQPRHEVQQPTRIQGLVTAHRFGGVDAPRTGED